MSRIILAAVALATASVFASCSADAGLVPAPEVVSPDRVASNAIQVEQREFEFAVARSSVAAGRVEFQVTNRGTQHHEFVVVPVERGRYGMPVGEVEAISPGESGAIRISLSPGTYRIVCLIAAIKPEGAVSHLALGMSAPFEVTDG